LIPGGVTGIFQ